MSETPEQQAQRHLVIVGASAGGVEALISLVSTLSDDFPAPLVFAQHLDPKRPSQLGTILERYTSLPVVTVQDKVGLADGTIYVVPADRHVQITDHDISLSVNSAPRPKPSIDRVLHSAAQIYGENLIAVILTGMGSDGQAGAQEVKKQGGTVIIQDPATAAFPSMPRSLSPAIVDISVSIEKIGPLLYQLLQQPVPPEQQVSPETDEENGQQLSTFLQQVRDVSGVDFSSYKRGTIQRRIQRRMAAVGATSLADYVAYVNRNSAEYQRLISSFLIKVTEFMRDQELFRVLEREVLPILAERVQESSNKELRIWSAGCATGEEAYSLAILTAEVLGDGLNGLNVKIFATDLDSDAIAFARRGLYPAAALSSLPPPIIKRYFIEHEDGYEVSNMIRSMLVFGEHDLGQRPPFPRIDMVVCRNVLIYFTRELQQRTLRLFAFSLRTGGFLVLGKSETITPFPDSFVNEYAQHKIFRRQGERLLIPPPLGNEQARITGHHRTQAQQQRNNLTGELSRMQQELSRTRSVSDNLLLKLPIGVVVVDARYDIHEINSAARRLLGIYQSAIGEDLIHLTGSLPPRVLRSAIDRTIQTREPEVVEEVAIEQLQTGERNFLQISCYPQGYEQEMRNVQHILLLIQDVTPVVHERQRLQAERDHQRALVDELQQQINDLKQQHTSLSTENTRLKQHIETLEHNHADAMGKLAEQTQQVERLQEVNQELVRANEELTSTNQQLRLMNDEFLMTSEEAQATTEEIETLSEETQATNEELETLNEELQGTVEELTTTTNDLTTRNDAMQRQLHTLEQHTAALRAMVQLLPDAAAVLAADGEALFANAAYDTLQAEDGIIEDAHGQRISQDSTPHARAARGEAFRLTYALHDGNGNRTWFEAQGQPVENETSQDNQGGVLIVRRRDSHDS